MANSYYTPSGNPGTGATGASATMRNEFASISTAFDLLPSFSGNANRAVVVNAGGTGLTVTTGRLALAGNLTTTGSFNTTLVQAASVTLTLPAVSGTLATLAGTETLSNKTITGSSIGSASPGTGAFTTLTTSSTLVVSGAATLSSTATVGSTLAVTGATTLSSTLAVTGATTLSSTLHVVGAATLSNGLTVTPAGISVTGSSTFASAVTFSGALTILQATAASTQPLRADQAWQEIATYTASASASVVIPLSSSFRAFRLISRRVYTANDGAIVGAQLSYDGGATYKTTANAWSAMSVTLGGVVGGNGSSSDTLIPITPGLTNANTNGWDASTDIYAGPQTASFRTLGFGSIQGPSYMTWLCGGSYINAAGAAGHMKLLVADGSNFTGTFILEGLP